MAYLPLAQHTALSTACAIQMRDRFSEVSPAEDATLLHLQGYGTPLLRLLDDAISWLERLKQA
jgi:hypothetical protein